MNICKHLGLNVHLALRGCFASVSVVFLPCSQGCASKKGAQPIHVVEQVWEELPIDQASLVAQTVKNLPAMWETWVQSQDWEDPLEKGMAIHSTILAWEIPWTEDSGRLVHGLAE